MSGNESKIPVGTLLVGKYRVAREIGRGGMAAVYEAEQLSLGKKVAVKVLASELSASTIVIERFFREARAAASVKSPYIVDVYDSGRLDDGRPFIAMELLEGESLYDCMARVRIIDVDTTIRVIVHTARGLVKAHAAGIVHRDLKPENIFLTKGEDGDDVCKILDFGLAKFYAPVNPEEKAAKRLTREGAVFGTPAYMSPEQVKGQGNVDHRADLWALGCMAYECLIGRPVWNMDQGVAMTFASIATGPIPVPSAARADLPPALDAWFKKCLERDPNKRYQSARELSDAFVESWGQRPASSASFPNVNMLGGSGRNSPQIMPIPAEAGEGELQVLRPVPPSPITGRRAPGSDPNGLFTNGRGSVGSDASVPLPLIQRSSADSPPPAADRDTPAPPRPKPSPLRMVLSAVFLGASVSAAIFVWVRYVNPQVFTPVLQSTATAPASAVPSGTNGAAGPVPDEPKWTAIISEAQRRFTGGDIQGSLAKLQEASALGPQAAAIAKVYGEQFRFVAKEATGSCKPVAFARPRISTDKRGERPAIRATPKGMLFTWTDDHEQKDHDHVYSVLMNETGKSIGPVRDLTPEAGDAQRPQLAAQSPDSDRTVLLYWDKQGRDAGVRVRMLDAEGRIDQMNGQSRVIGAAGRPGDYWPSIEKSPKGFIVVWQDDRDKDKEYDIFVRSLSNDLDTLGPETRLTDYHAPPKSKIGAPRVRYPSIAVAANTLLVAYRYERENKDRDRLIYRLRVPLTDLEKNGLEESKDPNRESREFGNDAKWVNEDKAPADAPAVGCGTEGCFVVWHGESGGAFVASIDPNVGRVQWRKKFSEKGGRPSIAVHDGQVAVAFYEGGRMKLAFLSREGISVASTLLRVNDGNTPRPTLAPGGPKGEWTLAWQDSDVPKGSPEVYASRVVCSR